MRGQGGTFAGLLVRSLRMVGTGSGRGWRGGSRVRSGAVGDGGWQRKGAVASVPGRPSLDAPRTPGASVEGMAGQ